MNQEVLYNYKRKTNPKGQDKKGTSAENSIKEYTAKRKRNNHVEDTPEMALEMVTVL